MSPRALEPEVVYPAALSTDPTLKFSPWSSVDVHHASISLPIQRLREAGGAFDLWSCRTEDLPPSVLKDPQSLNFLQPSELQRFEGFRFTRDRYQFLTARILVRSVLPQYADLKPDEWRFTQNAFGRPEISPEIQARVASLIGPAPLLFNLSRSGPIALCVVSTSGAIGVDVEDTRQTLQPAELATGVLAHAEREELTKVPEKERTAQLLRYWVLKEAYAKARGLGLTLDVQDLAFTGVGSGRIRVHFSNRVLDTPENWSFSTFELFDRFTSAVAYRPIVLKTTKP